MKLWVLGVETPRDEVSNPQNALIRECSFNPTDSSIVCVIGDGILKFMQLKEPTFHSIFLGFRRDQVLFSWLSSQIDSDTRQFSPWKLAIKKVHVGLQKTNVYESMAGWLQDAARDAGEDAELHVQLGKCRSPSVLSAPLLSGLTSLLRRLKNYVTELLT